MNIAKKITLGLLMIAPAAAARAEFPIHGPSPRSIHRTVQSVPAYRLARPQITTGTRITMFANFLQQDPGIVLLEIGGTTTRCELLEWCSNSVTVQLPSFGVAGPQDARIRIVLPNGRVAKSVSVMLVPQPSMIVHEETIPQPMPTAEMPKPAIYADSEE
ncbi:hypothetical protein [Stieleria mannarensis]|uniref:hypothetical protein n=1 Tax=Stieleria mannarensis TaxID=2755585 RepID=UPI0015FEDD5C|nr:hypothetical protein [Rhodopirellula sp. JC639]